MVVAHAASITPGSEGFSSMKIANMYRRVALVVCTLALLLLLFPGPQQAYADGGAPNLAYVVGGSNGISVIDIAQQKVTGTFALGGDPRTVYLSLDGRFLYITQPALGRVTMLSAKTGQTICHANVPGQPSLLAFDPGINTLYTAGNGAAVVTAIDSTSCAIKQTIKTNGPVYGLAVAVVGSGVSGGTGNQLWVTDATSLEVFTHTGLLTSIPISGGAQCITIRPGFTAYVTTRQGSVYAVDLATHKLSPALVSGVALQPMDQNAVLNHEDH